MKNSIIFLLLIVVSISVYYFLFKWEQSTNNFPTPVRKISQIFDFSSAHQYSPLYSKCYCQKDLVYMRNQDDKLSISVRDRQSYKLSSNRVKFTCDLYSSLRRGPGQKVISVVYSDSDGPNLDGLIQSADTFYPDWVIRVYYSKSRVNSSTVCEKQCRRRDNGSLYDNVDFCDIDEIPAGWRERWSGRYLLENSWKWLPIGDDFVDVVVLRKLTSCFIERELAAVNDWLDSNKTFHIMRDSKSQSAAIPDGLWGFYVNRDRELAQNVFEKILDTTLQPTISIFNSNPEEKILSEYVWPLVRNESIVHDSFYCKKNSLRASVVKPFPIKRDSFCVVGSSSCCRNGSFVDSISKCPLECRINPDWEYC